MEELLLLTSMLITLAAPENAQVNITQAGCGVTKQCVELPDNCDPAGNQKCLFTSVVGSSPVASGGTNLTFELSGQSVGYIGLGLVVNASEVSSMAFICAQNFSANGMFFFQTMQINNSSEVLTPTSMMVTDFRGVVKGNTIQCQFTFPSMYTTSSLLLMTGSVNINGLGSFTRDLISGPLDLTNPHSKVDTTAAPTALVIPTITTALVIPTITTALVLTNITTATNTTGSRASEVLHPHALLLLLCVIVSFVLHKA